MNEIRKLITRRILELLKDSTEFNIGGYTLHVLSTGELPKRYRVVVHVEEPDLAAEEAMKLLDRQNAGLGAREWVVVNGNESRDAKNAHFAALIGDVSLETLQICGFKPFCGLGRATKLLYTEHKAGTTTRT
ncbi:hypothetical protein ALC57_18572 [Trachymyrmex cornetzi]|uniref:DUF4780 domain-containing protein n=1 Tax=Trachymyrmex cornetzi TaxID=471704 RepID=A0A151IRH1_9HYME|nr:hypothetical protein ALC57_18572 [Trachymyrmex cornetzi]